MSKHSLPRLYKLSDRFIAPALSMSNAKFLVYSMKPIENWPGLFWQRFYMIQSSKQNRKDFYQFDIYLLGNGFAFSSFASTCQKPWEVRLYQN